MRRIAILAVAACVVATAVTASSASATPRGYKSCGKVDIGYTLAKVVSRRVRCASVRRWRKKVNSASFRCVWGGDEITVRLRCTKGRKRVRAYWGD